MIKIGILFGGPSREREISFAGGRTVFDNLDKTLFEPIPLFVDSHRRLIHLHWQYVYKGTIRDFYPPIESLPASPNGFQVYLESLGKMDDSAYNDLITKVGVPVDWSTLPQMIDFAFLTLHGEFGEDGQIQGLLESLEIPYTGSGIRACSIGIDKAFQKKMMEAGGFLTPKMSILQKDEAYSEKLETAAQTMGFPCVVRPCNQGSSIGVSIVKDSESLKSSVEHAFFRKTLDKQTWNALTQDAKVQFLRDLTDIRSGLGFPLYLGTEKLYHPEELLAQLNHSFAVLGTESMTLQAIDAEQEVIIEEFLDGKEFSCVVVRTENGHTVALPPTEIVKGGEVFDYRSKYLPGLSRKVTPIGLPDEQIEHIRKECERLFDFFQFGVYARIDGFIRPDGRIFLNDPNTTSGMLPSSFFFHQAAEIGLNPSRFLTFIIRASVWQRRRECVRLGVYDQLLTLIDQAIATHGTLSTPKKRVAVVLGGYSSERHISVESGRNIYEKLASSAKYSAVPVFLLGNAESFELWEIPIALLLKDNADDIRDKILHFKKHPIIEKIKAETSDITAKYVGEAALFEPRQLTLSDLKERFDEVFIGLHGRPGEDGDLQARLEGINMPFNGSASYSAAITINKYDTLQLLKKEGLSVTDQVLLFKNEYLANPESALAKAEATLPYPLIAKPVDDGCSSAVKKIHDRAQLAAFLDCLFREGEDLPQGPADILKLKAKEEFPNKQVALLEKLIGKEDAVHFLEITGGLLTHRESDGSIRYEMFEPSEALASGEVLSLEEKFLAGEGQNITPARYLPKGASFTHAQVSQQVRATLEKTARILGVSGYARIDAFVRVWEDGRAETIVIEVNSLPGMTPATCIYHQAALNGYKPYDFIDKILIFGQN